ncbi:retrovirus-related Pol polyprotein from transposon 297 [Trichonephila clavipes]|uniref:Retrovirus-related Pol polyprotein from transposon 297 n=1 Tax=Trichonephila clavipes TaxID=2585209 RepID=A0A8X6SP37_TRICX|nr:retrovirus-related Pol polyprotein from transposon 297 [Trichonephila clavipes]
MMERKVWDLVDHPDNIKILENRWVYTIKYDENNKIVRYKSRLVARDSDFATNRDDRVSMGGFITFIDETPISWRTFKQKSVSLSTMEAEHLNGFTIAHAYPMQNPKDLMFEEGQANYVNVLDLTKGYWQIPMAEEAKPYMAFATHHGQYQFCVMPFGKNNSGSNFQKVMNQVLVKHRAYCRSYIDDVAVFSKS